MLDISPKMQDFIRNCLMYEEDDRYDWESIFSHEFFIDSFKVNFTGDKKNSLKLAFVVADLRMTIHSKNLNVGKILDSLPK